jgi:dolichol-phosphate mannosyltransferase
MKALVVLPSFNERENIVRLVESILACGPDLQLCIVDDSSPDGTSELVKKAACPLKDRVHLITRNQKGGRGSAVRDGLRWGMRRRESFEAFVEMDCDFSHEPAAISRGLQVLRSGYDVVLGCRYPDGAIIGWPLGRRFFSFVANLLARILIERSIPDYTNGFRFYSAKAVQILLQHPQKHAGYIYLSESLSVLIQAGMRIGTFPICFRNRVRGRSNAGLREIGSALGGILAIAWQHHFAKRTCSQTMKETTDEHG